MTNEPLTSEQIRARETLRELFPKGSQVTTIVRHVSKSGMTRAIQVVGVDEHGVVGDVTWLIIRAGLGVRFGNHHGIKVGGAGMDMAWLTTYRLANALYGDGYALNNHTI